MPTWVLIVGAVLIIGPLLGIAGLFVVACWLTRDILRAVRNDRIW